MSKDTPIRDCSHLQSVAFLVQIPQRRLCSVRQRVSYNIEANASPLKSMEEEDVFISAKNMRRHRTLERATIWWYLTILWCTRVTESNENLHSIWAFAHTFIPFFYHYPAPPQIGEFQCQSSPGREVFEVYPFQDFRSYFSVCDMLAFHDNHPTFRQFKHPPHRSEMNGKASQVSPAKVEMKMLWFGPPRSRFWCVNTIQLNCVNVLY